MERAALSIGCNLGEREFYINEMERALRPLLTDVKVSRLMETEPVGVDGVQPNYLNRIVAGYYGASCRELLDACLKIEAGLGRRREKPRDSRTADIDILLFGNLEINGGELTVPHKELLNRRFCIEGLFEIDKEWVIPGTGGSIEKLRGEMSAAVRAQKIFFITD